MPQRLVDQLRRLIDPDGAGAEPDRESREAAAMVAEARDRLGALLAERRRLERQIHDMEAEAARLSGKAEHAVGAAREDLARAAMTRSGDIADRSAIALERIASIDRQSEVLEGAIVRLCEPPADGAAVGASRARLTQQLDELEKLVAQTAAPEGEA